MSFVFLFSCTDKVTAEKNGPTKAQSNNSSSSPPSSNSHVVAGNLTTTTTTTTTTSSSPPQQLEHHTSVAPVAAAAADISVTDATPAETLTVTQSTLSAIEGLANATTASVVAATTAVEANHINNNADKPLTSAATNDNGCPNNEKTIASTDDEPIDEEDESLPAITNASDASATGKVVSTGSLKKVFYFF